MEVSICRGDIWFARAEVTDERFLECGRTMRGLGLSLIRAKAVEMRITGQKEGLELVFSR